MRAFGKVNKIEICTECGTNKYFQGCQVNHLASVDPI